MAFDPNAAAVPGSGVYGLPHSPQEAHVVLIPVPFEATTSYGGGTSDGPETLRHASRQVDLFDFETGRPYERGIAMLDHPAHIRALSDEAKTVAAPVIEAGGFDRAAGGAEVVARVDALCDQMNEWVYAEARRWLEQRKLVGAVGGDHSISYGIIRACAERHPGMGVLHLDAHADLREAYEGFTWSHASIMFNVAERLGGVSKLVQVGIRDLGDAEFAYIERSRGRVITHFDAELTRRRFDGIPWNRQVDEIVAALPQDVFLSFDIDGLDPTLCPHTGTPVPGGLSFAEATALVSGVVRAGKRIVGFDLNEVAPGPEGNEWDGNVGARLLYKMIGWALKSVNGDRLL